MALYSDEDQCQVDGRCLLGNVGPLMGAPPATVSIFHIVHYDKLPSIIADGLLLSDARIRTRSIAGTGIGMGDIKERRLRMAVSCHPGCTVGEFVPF